MRNFKLEKDLEANLLVSGRESFFPKPPVPSVPLGLHTAQSTPGCEGKLWVFIINETIHSKSYEILYLAKDEFSVLPVRINEALVVINV